MQARRKFALTLPSGVLVLGERTLVMGVLNQAAGVQVGRVLQETEGRVR